MIVLLLIVGAYVLSIVFLRTRNKAHLAFSRQLTDFSTFMVPFNLPAYGLSKVPNTPRVDPRQLPQLRALEDNWEVIRDEALALQSGGYIAAKDDLPASSFYRDGRWTSFYLKVYDNDIPSARELAPRTMALIDQVPGMNVALFAVLNPGKHLGAHHDPFAFTLRYSLGLSTPNSEDCGLMVNGDPYVWRDGESILFDETYLHSAYNRTETPRIILMTDIDRPLRWSWVERAYTVFGRFFNSLFYTDNLDPSRSGIGNRLSGALKSYKNTMRGLKRRHRSLYVTGKWALHLALLVVVVDVLL